MRGRLPPLDPPSDSPHRTNNQPLVPTGQYAYFVLHNGTPYEWVRTYQNLQNMNAWDFPETILANSRANYKVYVEYGADINRHSSYGDVYYELRGVRAPESGPAPPTTFQIKVQSSEFFVCFPDFPVTLELDSGRDETLVPRGGQVELRWRDRDEFGFVLIGTQVDSLYITELPQDQPLARR